MMTLISMHRPPARSTLTYSKVLLVVFIALCCYFWSMTRLDASSEIGTPPSGKSLVQPPLKFDLILDSNSDGGMRTGSLDGFPFFFEARNDTPPRAILFVAHGCSHGMTDWWQPAPDGTKNCENCIGLPEEVAIVQLALQPEFNLLVVAMSSLNRENKCWSDRDGIVVARVLAALQLEYNNVPILAFGASSGGAFVSTVLVAALSELGTKLAGCISQIMARTNDATTSVPTVFITMDRDRHTDMQAAKYVEQASKSNFATAPSKHIRIAPKVLTPDFFQQRIGGVEYSADGRVSERMARALRDAGMLQGDGLLLQDPRQSDWRTVLRPLVPIGVDSFRPDESPVSEVLNAAWGMHEMTRDGVQEGLDFLLQQI